ncbi:MAG TPA: zinc dependent phospholipase C family protein [Bryobacteraceae bacterium]|nr:zinc dependent phospholipase C family protein [Bryobacteraceae bacterium]
MTHHLLIDQAWKTVIVPILLDRFPSLTTEQLREAHAYAYGGCVVQDFGYYPFANAFFSDLTHYVRTGDFVQKLFQHAHTANEFAFAIGALSHYVGDSIGHSQSTNPSVAIMFPKLRDKYGSSVNYAEGKHQHGQVEWAFDANQAAKLRLAPLAYVRDIGLEVPREQLAAAFYETYGIPLREIVSGPLPAMKTFRFGARSFLPDSTYAEAVLHQGRFPADTPGPELDEYEREIGQLPKEEGWDQYRRKPGVGTHLLAGLIVVLPKVGMLKMLAIKDPTVETERAYIASVNLSIATLAVYLRQLNGTKIDTGLTDRDLDTGQPVVPGGYPLTDKTYARLLARLAKRPTQPIPAGLKQDIIAYYADPAAPISTKNKPKEWAAVQENLQVLIGIKAIPE